MTSGWAPVLQEQEITHSSSVSGDQRLEWCAWTDKTRYRI